MRNTFGTFALPIVWDYTEVSPVSDTSGNYGGALEWVSRFIFHALQGLTKSQKPEILARSATAEFLEKVDLVLTDPPYYDAIPYSDLMDFFYIWLR